MKKYKTFEYHGACFNYFSLVKTSVYFYIFLKIASLNIIHHDTV